MKIFNWVHRKLNWQASSVPLHPRKGEVKMSQLNIREVKSGDEDTEALLGWRDGLLAIGTLGLHTNQDSRPDYIMFPNSEILGYPKDGATYVKYVLDESTLMEEMLTGEQEDEIPLVFKVYSNHEIEEVDEKKIVSSIKTEDVTDVKESDVKGYRTTLADLFKAEAVASKNCVGKSVLILKENKKKDDEETGKHKKFPSSFSGKLVKKLIPSHDAQPIQKINNMMRKMMKRKIHPELLHQTSACGIILENQNQVIDQVQGHTGMVPLVHTELVVVD